jgi:hypothetical protein
MGATALAVSVRPTPPRRILLNAMDVAAEEAAAREAAVIARQKGVFCEMTRFMHIPRVLTLAVSLISGYHCVAQSALRVTDINTTQLPGGTVSVPAWANGLMVQWTQVLGTTKPKIWAFDSTGSFAIPVTEVWFPNTAAAAIHAATVTPTREIVASILAWSSSGQMSTLLVFISRSGIVKVSQTPAQFDPEHLAYSPDGVLWAFGRRAATSPADIRTTYRTIQRFGPDGTWLSGSVLSTDLNPTAEPTANPAWLSINGESFLLVSSTRKFLFSSRARKFVEMDNEGRTLRNAILNFPPEEQNTGNGRPNMLTHATITPSGKIFISFNGGSRLYTLHPDSLAWTIVDPFSYDNQYKGAYGSDGESLIMATMNNRYGWFAFAPK